MIGILSLFALAQTVAAPNPPRSEEWPAAKPGRAIATPDWSDPRLYPKAARQRSEEGSVTPELLVGTDGKPKACRILESSKFAELDVGTCELMMRIRFEPARNAHGVPIPSVFSREVIWLLTDPRPFASSTLKARLDTNEGQQTSCEVTGGEGPYVAAWSALACPILKAVPYYLGSRAQNRVSASVEFRLDAGDHAAALDAPWVAGTQIAAEKLSFTVSSEGQATMCMPLERYGFGPRDVADASPCGSLLPLLWFEDAPNGAPLRKGVLETRVVLVSSE